MKVQELVEKLKAFDPNTEVLVYAGCAEASFFVVDDVSLWEQEVLIEASER